MKAERALWALALGLLVSGCDTGATAPAGVVGSLGKARFQAESDLAFSDRLVVGSHFTVKGSEVSTKDHAAISEGGFMFGDGVYEFIPVYSRRPFRLAEHISRLKASLAAVELANPHDDTRWGEIIRNVIAANPWEDQGVYLQVTRGAAARSMPSRCRSMWLMATPWL